MGCSRNLLLQRWATVLNFKKTVYCDENHFTALYYLVLAYKESGRKREAEKQFRIVVHTIDALDNGALKREVAGHSGNYIFSMCIDSMDIKISSQRLLSNYKIYT